MQVLGPVHPCSTQSRASAPRCSAAARRGRVPSSCARLSAGQRRSDERCPSATSAGYPLPMKNGLGNPARREALFGGKGEVLVWDLLGSADLPPFTAVLACELAPGGHVGSHRQEHYPEIVVFTEGQGTAEVDGATCPIAPGTLIALP